MLPTEEYCTGVSHVGLWGAGILVSRLAVPFWLGHTALDDLAGDHAGVGATKAKKPLSLESLKYLLVLGVSCGRLGFPRFSMLVVVALLGFFLNCWAQTPYRWSAHGISSCRWVTVPVGTAGNLLPLCSPLWAHLCIILSVS